MDDDTSVEPKKSHWSTPPNEKFVGHPVVARRTSPATEKFAGQLCFLFVSRRSPIGDKYLTKEFYDIGRRMPKHVRRQTRQAASHVDFRAEPDLERIPEDENSRRKHRSKPQHCPSCLCQSSHENPGGLRLNDISRRKNLEKLEATLTQHLDYSTSKVASNAMRNVHGRVGQSSPRNRTVQQRPQYHRPGTSVHHCQDRNNLGNAVNQRHSRKHTNAEELECTRLDSQFRDIVNLDVEAEDTDLQFPYQQVDTAKFGKLPNFRWHSPPGEPHSELETDFPADQWRGGCLQSKRRHSGQGEGVHEDCRVDEMKPWMETVSTDLGDDWQYERDKQELMELREGVREYAKRKNAGCNKLQREETERDDESLEPLEKINRLVRKPPSPRQRNTAGSVARTSLVARQQRKKSSIDQELGVRTSRIDGRETYRWCAMDAGSRTGVSREREVGRNLDGESFDGETASLLRAEDSKEDDAASETEEDARQLALRETETDRLERKSTKILDESRVGRKKKNSREQSERNDEKEERDLERSLPQRKGIDSRERCGGKKDKSANTYGAKQLTAPRRSSHVRSDSEDECADEKRINSLERFGGSKEIEGKTHERSRHNCCRGSRAAKDPEIERNDARKFIDEMIDKSLSRETERGSAGTLRDTNKKDAEVSEKVAPNRGTSDEATKFERDDFIAKKFSNETKRLAVESIRRSIICESRNTREYARELKNRRWTHLNNIRSDLLKLFELEEHLDSCSPERHSSLPTVTTDINASGRETNGPPEE